MTRPTGGRVELLFVRPEADGAWHVLARPAKSAKPGMRLLAGDALELEVVAAGDGGERTVRAVRGVIEERAARPRRRAPTALH